MTLSAQDFTRRAGELVAGDRREQHGDAYANHANIASLWSAYLRRAGYLSGHVNLLPRDVMLMMALLKIARTLTGRYSADDLVDGIGYLALAGAEFDREYGQDLSADCGPLGGGDAA